MSFKKTDVGPGEMVQWLRALAAFTESLSLIPSNPPWGEYYCLLVTPIPEKPISSSGFHGVPTLVVGTQVHINKSIK